MAVTGKSLFWKFLEASPEACAPAALMNLLNEIESFSAQQGFARGFEPRRDGWSEEAIRTRMAEAKSAYARKSMAFPILPSSDYQFQMEGDRWHLAILMTAIPHIRGGVIDKPGAGQAPPAYRSHLVRYLVDEGVVDLGVVEDNRLYGRTWDIYFYCKIQLMKGLTNRFEIKASDKGPLLVAPRIAFAQLEGQSSKYSTLRRTPAEVEKFLDERDQLLLDSIGRDALARYLGGADISLRDFLRAQKPSLFKIW
jgi:hypothetical protein